MGGYVYVVTCDVLTMQVGIEALAALAAAAPKKLKHLYLSEELSPSSFGDAALAPVLAVATGATSTSPVALLVKLRGKWSSNMAP